SFSGLIPGTHTISVSVKGAKGSPAATGTFVSVDAFKAGGTLVKTPATPAASYSWRKVVNAGALGGSYVTSDVRGSSVKFTSNGTGIDWYTIRGPNQGKATVSLDGTVVATLDDYAPSTSFGLRWSSAVLPDKAHTLTITVLGKKRTASTGRSVGIDAFRVP